MTALAEAVKGVQDFLDGHHQVTYLGKHGDFHIYSAVHLHTEGQTPNPSEAMMAHHKKVHTEEEYHAARYNFGKAAEEQVDPKPTDQHFVSDKLIARGSASHTVLRDAAEAATRKLRAAGLPSQTRHVIAIDQSKQTNYNTGVQGDVGGHWHKKHHVIAVNRAEINGTRNDTAAAERLLTHEWAHAFHDEMSKPQKAAWRGFYEKHVAGAVVTPGTDEDKDRYVKEFHAAYMQHPNVRAFDRQLQARRNVEVPGARMHQSIHTSSPDWWHGMLSDGHLSTVRDGGVKGVVAQTSHTLHGYSDPSDKSTRKAIRKNAYVHVRAVDPSDPTDRAHMARAMFQAHEHADLLAVSPLGKPHHVAIVDRRNLKYNPTDGAPKVGTHLLYDNEKTLAMYHAGMVKDAKDELTKLGDRASDDDKFRLHRVMDSKASDIDANSVHAPHTFMMSDRFKSEVELSGSEHRTVRDLIQHIRKRGALNLTNAVYDTRSRLSGSHPKIEHPGGDDATETRIVNGVLNHLEAGSHHDAAIASAVKYNVVPKAKTDKLVGAHHHNDRAAAFGQQRTFSPYGASNDQELFATTVEHMASVNPTATRFSLPHHQRKLVQAWRNVVSGAPVAERIAEAVGTRPQAERRTVTFKAGHPLLHGAHAARAAEVEASGKLMGRAPTKTNGGLTTEGGMVWFAWNRDHAKAHAGGNVDPIAASADAPRQHGAVFEHRPERALKTINRRAALTAEQAATVADHFGMERHKIPKGTPLNIAVEYRAFDHVTGIRATKTVPSYASSTTTMHEMYPGVLKALGYDGFHDASGVALAVGDGHLPVRKLA